MLPTGGRASDVSFVASNSMFHDPELSVWNVMGSFPPNKVSPCTNLHEDIFIRRKSHNHILK